MRALSWAQETRRNHMHKPPPYYPETRTTDQQVIDAVYCWVMVNHPQVIEDARELVTA